MSYVNDAFYAELVEQFCAWPDEALADPVLRERCRMLLEREARLLDQQRFDDWLALYAAECAYWIPATPAGDPRREVAVAFDDRRRLEDRVYRLRTGHAWSQMPPSRTVRLVSNVEVFGLDKDRYLVRSTLMLDEFRSGERHLWSGWCGHRLRQRGSGLLIEVRQVNLIDCDQSLRNPSLLL